MFKYLILGGFARFMIEILRTNTKYIFGLSGAQYISIIMMLIGTYQIYKRRNLNDTLEEDVGWKLDYLNGEYTLYNMWEE